MPSDAKFTDTWRGVQNNLTSTATDQSLSAAQGKILNETKAAMLTLTTQDLNSVTTPGIYSAGGSNSVTNKPSGVSAFGLIVIHSAGGAYYTQILYDGDASDKSFRRHCNSGTWTAWTEEKLTDTNTWRGIQNNLTSDATDQSLSAAQGKVLKGLVDAKLPLAGGTMTGSITFAGIGNTATSNKLTWSGGSDGADIYYQTTASEQGNLVLNLRDDSNCYLRIAKNGTFKSYFSPDDGNFHGNVNGTADNSKALKNVSSRPASANFNLSNSGYINNITYQLATSNMTEGKPPTDACMLTLGWDGNGWGSQLALGNNQNCHAYIRGANGSNNTSTYGDWRTILDSNNYNNYAPTKTGGGASGTWGINITGKANTAGTADTAKACTGNSATATKINSRGNQTAITAKEEAGLYMHQVYNNGYPCSYGNVITAGGVGGGQLLLGWSGADKGIEHLYYRNRRDVTTEWSDWRTIAFTTDNVASATRTTYIKDSGNSKDTTFAYSKTGLAYDKYTYLAAWNGYELRAVDKTQFATAGHTHSYLPLSGGTMNGQLNFAANTLNRLGENVAIGDQNTAGTLFVKGLNANPAIQLLNSDGTKYADVLTTMGGTMSGTLYFGSTSYYVDTSGVANFSKAYGAIYNDYAELFPKGEETRPGEIIALDTDSKEERYIKATGSSRRIVGVHSDEFAMLIGGEKPTDGQDLLEANKEKYIPVALAGRVKTYVKGIVHTGDYIVLSDVPGVGQAVASDENIDMNRVVGYAVESDDREDIRRIRIRVKG